jgi:threonyl-tRNA synthetase
LKYNQKIMAKETKQDNLYAMRHSLAHIMAAAIKELWPKAKFGVGPVIENGFYYDIDLGVDKVSEEDFPKTEQVMSRIIKSGQTFDKFELSIDEAIDWAKKENQPYKLELLNDLKRTGTTVVKDLNAAELGTITDGVSKKDKVSFYKNGNFTDLCRGPHVANTKEIKVFKLMRVAGAYWRGNEKNPQMQRIYGVAFKTKEDLAQYLQQIEEAKKRDHRILGDRLDLFALSPEIGQGLVLWLPKGTVLKEEIEALGKKTEESYGYQRVSTPHIAKEELFYTSGHLPYYQDDMYPPMKMDNETYYLKPMNCPHMHMIVKARQRSYRELPLRLAEFGTVYRNEDSGTLMGLMRVRGMTQNDAHIYCTEEQVVDELIAVIDLHRLYYDLFAIKDYYIELALPDFRKKPDKYFNDRKAWDKAISLLREAAKRSGIKVIEKAGEAAFYGPKFDFNIKSVTGREFGASTNQLDFGSGKRFGLMYTDKSGQEKSIPYIIHRAPLGSDERFIGFLIEHYGGAFPIWLAPEQVRLLTVNDSAKLAIFTQKIHSQLQHVNIRSTIDNSNETVSKKIRSAELMKIPYIVVIGEEELKSDKLKPRVRHDLSAGFKGELVSVENFIKTVQNEAKSRVGKSSL